MYNPIGWILFATTFLVLSLVLLRNWLKEQKRLREYDKPVVCVCQVNNRVGVVLKEDYDKASREHWKPYFLGQEELDRHGNKFGHRLNISPTFVFEPCDGYSDLIHGCYIEQAVFHVPQISYPRCTSECLREAYQYIHGKPFDGMYVGSGFRGHAC